MKPTLTVLAFLLFSAPSALASGDVLLRSDPGAAIFVNGRFIAVVGKEGKWILLKGLPAGVHTAQARMKGLLPKEKKFRVVPGKRVEVVLTVPWAKRIPRKPGAEKPRPPVRPRLSRFALGFGGTHQYLKGKFFGRSDLSNIHHDELVEGSYRLDALSLTYRPLRFLGIGFSFAYSHLSLRGSDTLFIPGGLAVIFSLKESLKANRMGAHIAFRIPLDFLNAFAFRRSPEDTGNFLQLKVETGYLKAVPESDRSWLAVRDSGVWLLPYTPVRYCRNAEGLYFEVSLTLEIEVTHGFTLAVGSRYFNLPPFKFRHHPYEEYFIHHGKGERLSGWTFLTIALVFDL